ncbi:MAG: pantetheine-phosphate adenylyltransferase [Bacteroidales bacterium]|nr:pantetheine-phosphate adenylyltransferase [Bacteroidales bacterium]
MAKKRIALFQGSFDPFTRGHESIVKRALSIFDEVVVAVVCNSQKRGFLPADMRVKVIEDAFRGEERVKVVCSDGLTVDVAKEVGACCLLRGIRNAIDYEYEKGNAEVNLRLSGIETIYLTTSPELSHVSSTIVRELLKFDKNIKDYMPAGLSSEMLNEVTTFKP